MQNPSTMPQKIRRSFVYDAMILGYSAKDTAMYLNAHGERVSETTIRRDMAHFRGLRSGAGASIREVETLRAEVQSAPPAERLRDSYRCQPAEGDVFL
jgi:hypothetical protein